MPALFTRIETGPSWRSASSIAPAIDAVRDVEWHSRGAPAVHGDLGDELLQAVGAASGHSDVRTGSREHLDEAPAEAGRGARDEGRLPGDIGVKPRYPLDTVTSVAG